METARQAATSSHAKCANSTGLANEPVTAKVAFLERDPSGCAQPAELRVTLG